MSSMIFTPKGRLTICIFKTFIITDIGDLDLGWVVITMANAIL